jgi:EAL domain-containing protein (putative c-di-GMP-specific phosphodiesterase class I)
MLEATGFPPHLLELELTESVIMEDVIDAAKRLGDLHALGINLAVDDFGTGYSSLSYLKRFPIRSLKVDRSFVRDIAHDQSSAAIARAIIAFGSALGLKVIAEGVESHDQYDILRSSGCDELQGYLFSRPVPAEDARKLATERRHLPLVRA